MQNEYMCKFMNDVDPRRLGGRGQFQRLFPIQLLALQLMHDVEKHSQLDQRHFSTSTSDPNQYQHKSQKLNNKNFFLLYNLKKRAIKH